MHPADIVKPSIRVLTYAGAPDDIQNLARAIRFAASEDMAAVDPARVVGTIEFDEPVTDVDALARRLTDRGDTILQLVTHANFEGVMGIQDLWGNLRLTPDTLARMVKGSRVKVAIVIADHGAPIAKALVDAQAVGLAIGHTTPLSMGAALQFSRGFYRSLVQGNSLQTATADGETFAAARRRNDLGKFEVWSRRSNYPDDPLFGPQFHIIGTPIVGCDEAVDELTHHLAPYAVSHISKADFGDDSNDMEWSLRSARVILVLVDNEPLSDRGSVDEGAFTEEVVGAVNRARTSEVRVVPTFLAKTEPRVPLGLKRLTPAFLHRDFGGSYQKLAAALKKALEKDLKGR